jgi:chemotaxis protein MotB
VSAVTQQQGGALPHGGQPHGALPHAAHPPAQAQSHGIAAQMGTAAAPQATQAPAQAPRKDVAPAPVQVPHKDGGKHDAGHKDGHKGHEAAGDKDGGHGDDHGGHAGHSGHKKHEHEHGPGTPPWLISFGDMMTLFLCFFIMLVTMAKSQDAGLMANGLGPFIASLRMRGMDGALDESRVLDSINNYRRRFGLEPIKAEEMQGGATPYHDTVQVQDLVRSALRNSYSLDQPLVATFAEDSDVLSEDARHYLDLLSSSLRPGQGQVLVLEGHADDADVNFDGDDALLALRRATAVADYFVKELAFVSVRVEPRAWPRDEKRPGASARGVDAHLIQPVETEP